MTNFAQSIRLRVTALSIWLCCFTSVLADSNDASSFLRFIDNGGAGSRMETAIVAYTNPDGVKVDLIAAVHIADRQYYESLNKLFTKYDALLYELIRDDRLAMRPEVPSTSMISTMQRSMKSVLDLDFQLDAIDYSRSNFVHADMTSRMFSRMQRERGESVLTFLLDSMMAGWQQQLEGNGSQMNLLQLVAAFTSKDRALSLKYIMGKEFGQMEAMMAGLEEADDGEGSVILSGRNKVAMEVFKQQLNQGKKHLGIFYGAGHMPGMERILFEMGFQKSQTYWMTAWDIRPKPSVSTSEEGTEDASKE